MEKLYPKICYEKNKQSVILYKVINADKHIIKNT